MKPAVLLQAFYKRGKFVALPSPADGSSAVWWWDHLASQAHALARSGFTAVWLPPVTKAAQGASAAALGYSVFDDYDIGSKNQKASVHTRYGSRDQLARMVAMMRANGIGVYLDIQDNHRKGGAGPDAMTFRYLDADGQPGGGRFPKDPGCFHTKYPSGPLSHGFAPDIPQDPHVPLGTAELQPPFHMYFGPDLAPMNGKPPRYVFDQLLEAGEWLTRAVDAQGYRLDHVPGISTDFLRAFLDRPAMRGKFAVGEYFSGDLGALRHWVADPNGMANRCSAFDFPLWGMFLQMCNHPERFNMADLDHAGLAGADPFHAVTFVENHDTESRPDIIPVHVTHNKALAYAYILTSEGLPCVFYKDYSTDAGCLGMKPVIDNLIWIHQNIAEGPTEQRWKDRGVFAFERLGGPHLLVALNSDLHTARSITVDTAFGPHTPLHDYTGHSGDAATDATGRVTVTIPRNEGGLGYVCYSRAGIDTRFALTPSVTTQVYEGAQDLDIKPASIHEPVRACRVWVAAGSSLAGTLDVDDRDWTDATSVVATLEAPDASEVSRVVVTRVGRPPLAATATSEGWYTVRVRASNTPPTNRKPSFKLTITYTSPAVSDTLAD